eukprot:1522467-Prymnesium_polylepis.3
MSEEDCAVSHRMILSHCACDSGSAHRRKVLNVVVVDTPPVRGGCDAKADRHLHRVLSARIVQARQALVEVVLARVATALVQQADVAVALDTRQRDAALMRHHLLGRERIDACVDVAEGSAAAAETLEDGVLCGQAHAELRRGDPHNTAVQPARSPRATPVSRRSQPQKDRTHFRRRRTQCRIVNPCRLQS